MPPLTQTIQRVCFAIFLAICSLMGVQCAHVELNGLNPNKFNASPEEGGQPPEPEPANPNPFALVDCGSVDTTFSTRIMPLLARNCLGCHSASQTAFIQKFSLDASEQGTDTPTSLTHRLVQSPLVNHINPHESPLLLLTLAKQAGGHANRHPGGDVFDNPNMPDFQTLYCWLKTGLKNDLDTSDFNFGDDIYPVFFDACDGCHNGSASSQATANFTESQTPQQMYAEVIRQVSPGNPDSSPFFLKPTRKNDTMHSGGLQFEANSAKGKIIENWIRNGAPAD